MTHSTSYAASIKPFQCGKDGRGAWIALIGQYAGRDKWEVEIKKQEQLLHSRIWKSQSKFLLDHFITQHWNMFISMQGCAEHIQYQLLNAHLRVGYLLDVIQCSDAPLQAAMASVQTDDGLNGMHNDFEATNAHLVAYDPVAKKCVTSSSQQRQQAGKCTDLSGRRQWNRCGDCRDDQKVKYRQDQSPSRIPQRAGIQQAHTRTEG